MSSRTMLTIFGTVLVATAPFLGYVALKSGAFNVPVMVFLLALATLGGFHISRSQMAETLERVTVAATKLIRAWRGKEGE